MHVAPSSMPQTEADARVDARTSLCLARSISAIVRSICLMNCGLHEASANGERSPCTMSLLPTMSALPCQPSSGLQGISPVCVVKYTGNLNAGMSGALGVYTLWMTTMSTDFASSNKTDEVQMPCQNHPALTSLNTPALTHVGVLLYARCVVAVMLTVFCNAGFAAWRAVYSGLACHRLVIALFIACSLWAGNDR